MNTWIWRVLIFSSLVQTLDCITLGTRAGLEPQRGGKAVTVLPLVISRLHDKMKHSPATPQEYDGGNPTLLHAVMREMFLCTCFECS